MLKWSFDGSSLTFLVVFMLHDKGISWTNSSAIPKLQHQKFGPHHTWTNLLFSNISFKFYDTLPHYNWGCFCITWLMERISCGRKFHYLYSFISRMQWWIFWKLKVIKPFECIGRDYRCEICFLAANKMSDSERIYHQLFLIRLAYIVIFRVHILLRFLSTNLNILMQVREIKIQVKDRNERIGSITKDQDHLTKPAGAFAGLCSCIFPKFSYCIRSIHWRRKNLSKTVSAP